MRPARAGDGHRSRRRCGAAEAARGQAAPAHGDRRGHVERPIELDPTENQLLDKAGGDSAASDVDANVGGAPASAGLDSGGAVGGRRGRAVGRPGSEYEWAPRGETTQDAAWPEAAEAEEVAGEGAEESPS